MIIRRHKCESCGVIFECVDCSEISEMVLVDWREKRDADNQMNMQHTIIYAPDCMRKFECEECKHD